MTEKIAAFTGLRGWFAREKREFPWRAESTSPYAVWVSEVMLQQTRAEVVVPYFLRWMKLFPTIKSLAEAVEVDVLKAWEGLGYYARARRLWKGARHLVQKQGGTLPESYEDLLEIPGFGPYTAGAVASFAFHRRAAAIDGNVTRVLTRFFAIEEEVGRSWVQKELRNRTLELLPQEEPWVVMEALIELGALICKKKPMCSICPLSFACQGHKQQIAEFLPRKKASPKMELLQRDVLVLVHEKEILIRQVGKGEVMEGLYEFPYFERDLLPLEKKVASWLGVPAVCQTVFDSVQHSFTRFRAQLFPSLWEVSGKSDIKGYEWKPIDVLSTLPFSAGHRRILNLLEA